MILNNKKRIKIIMSIYQDWDEVVLRKPKKIISSNAPKPKIIVDDGEMPEKLKTYSKDLSIALQTARQAKGLSQADLAKKFNIQPSIINDIENGRAIYNRKTYSSLMRFLGVDVKSMKLPN